MDDELKKCDWNINDAKEALECAVGMRDWEGVKKYANQIQEWEAKRNKLLTPLPFATGPWKGSANTVKA